VVELSPTKPYLFAYEPQWVMARLAGTQLDHTRQLIILPSQALEPSLGASVNYSGCELAKLYWPPRMGKFPSSDCDTIKGEAFR